MTSEAEVPEIIECELRLHASPPATAPLTEASFADWSTTVAGFPVTFRALAITARGAWNGPLSPGVDIATPVLLEDPHWTVFLPASKGLPVVTGRVGRPLTVGECFTLEPGQHGVWHEGIVFDGAIVLR
jgi:hypothetical protein